MSQRLKFSRHLHQMDEIRNILNAMKNLAFLETRKLDKRLQSQKTMVAELEDLAADFLGFYPYHYVNGEGHQELWILFGSERSLCGNFNGSLLAQLPLHLQQTANAKSLIPVGQKLCQLLQGDTRVRQYFRGPDVAEEVSAVLADIVNYLGSLQAGNATFIVNALFHQADSNQIISTRLLPPFKNPSRTRKVFGHPPLLYLGPDRFFTELVDFYLFISLQEIACMSLMAENQQRIQHTEGAIRHLEEKIANLTRKYHILRQEEITEEIEIILLNALKPDRRQSDAAPYGGTGDGITP